MLPTATTRTQVRRSLIVSGASGLLIASALNGAAAGTGTAASVERNQPATRAMSVQPVLLTDGLRQPTAVVGRSDRARLYVAERTGRVREFTGRLRARPYLDLRGVVNASAGEQGLLGLAFKPGNPRRPTLFLSYTNRAGALVVARVKAKSRESHIAQRRTLRTVLKIAHPGPTNHNGGALTFGRDGMLYISTGDGGGNGDPRRNAQNLRSPLGKILRIDVGRSCGNKRYCVPPGNPFRSLGGKSRLIWAYGLRNPWRMTTDAATGNLWIADVGQDRYEEINVLPAGAAGRNFGWSCREGNATYNADQCGQLARYVAPVTTLCHTGGVPGCRSSAASGSVTGGYVYRGRRTPVLVGTYLYADFIGGNVYAYTNGTAGRIGQLPMVTSFGQTRSRELVATTYSGRLYRLDLRG